MQRQDDRARPRADETDVRREAEVETRRQPVGMTQEALAGALGAFIQQVQKFENGANRISASRLRQIAAALQVPVSHFHETATGTGDGSIDGVTEVAEPVRVNQDQQLLRAFADIQDEALRQRILHFVEGLASKT